MGSTDEFVASNGKLAYLKVKDMIAERLDKLQIVLCSHGWNVETTNRCVHAPEKEATIEFSYCESYRVVSSSLA